MEGATGGDSPSLPERDSNTKFHDYRRYDGPPNEPIYASVQRILSNSSYLADRVLSTAAAEGNNNNDETGYTVEEGGFALDSRSISSDEDAGVWNSDTEALLDHK